jgi:hypothetical protein
MGEQAKCATLARESVAVVKAFRPCDAIGAGLAFNKTKPSQTPSHQFAT